MVVLTSFPPPTDGIKHEQPQTRAVVNNRELGTGTLYIAESRLAWVDRNTQQGFSLEYPHVAVHAISRDLQTYPYECLYVMLDTYIEEDGMAPHSESDDEKSDEDSGITEMLFVPEDKGMLDAMYQAMSFCQTLHPDPQESISEDDDDDDQFEDADSGGEYVIGNGINNLAMEDCPNGIRQNGVKPSDEEMAVAEGQFEDADSSMED